MKADAFKGLRFLFQSTLILSLVVVAGCNEDYQPKPEGHFRIGLPEKSYERLETHCPYSFAINKDANWIAKDNCWGDVRYPSIRANVQLTYKDVENEKHLFTILKESQDLAYKHSARADGIGERFYENKEKSIYGIMYKMEGNSATSSQFFLTDSTSHFLRGVLYFFSPPDADSLKPVNDYMQDEMIHLIETLEWK